MAWGYLEHTERWAALQDQSFATPLKGAVGRIAETFGLSASDASGLLIHGISQGAIALMDTDGKRQWLPTPRGLATNLDWAEGCLCFEGLQPITLAIHWPDVERAAGRRAALAVVTIEGELGTAGSIALAAPSPEASATNSRNPLVQHSPQKRSKTGPKGDLTGQAVSRMLADLKSGGVTQAALCDLKQEALAAAYGVRSRSTAAAARDRALSEFVGVLNSDN